MLVGSAIGTLFMVFSIPLPELTDDFLTLLGGTASPCALGTYVFALPPLPLYSAVLIQT